jgi:hypothetical protein
MKILSEGKGSKRLKPSSQKLWSSFGSPSLTFKIVRSNVFADVENFQLPKRSASTFRPPLGFQIMLTFINHRLQDATTTGSYMIDSVGLKLSFAELYYIGNNPNRRKNEG